MGGTGSAYGGSGSGSAFVPPLISGSVTGYSGGSTPYGDGGARVVQSGSGHTWGNNGTGIGHGYGARTTTTDTGTMIIQGSAAWYNGTNWVDITTRTATTGEEGRIYLKYLGV
jgi:hypothetical protein